jgi:hypothetical protein
MCAISHLVPIAGSTFNLAHIIPQAALKQEVRDLLFNTPISYCGSFYQSQKSQVNLLSNHIHLEIPE